MLLLVQVVRDMRKTVQEQRELEEALKTRAVLHDEELSKLYEEMESQIEMERQRVKRQEQEREQKVKSYFHDCLFPLHSFQNASIFFVCKLLGGHETFAEVFNLVVFVQLREDLSEEIQQKEKQLQELITKKNSLSEQVKQLQGNENNVREENDLLIRKNEELEDVVRKLDRSYHETQQYLKHVKDQMCE